MKKVICCPLQKKNGQVFGRTPSRKVSKREIIIETIIHLMVWTALISLPFLLAQYHPMSEAERPPMPMFPSFIMMAFCLVVFYMNYLVFTPFLLFRERFRLFYLLNVVLVLLLAFFMRCAMDGSMDFLNVGQLSQPPLPVEHRDQSAYFNVMTLRDALFFALSALVSVLMRIAVRWREAEMARHDAEQRRVQAELSNLKNQLNPHFLLNTLNNIYALVAIDGQRAQEALLKLSKLLRYLLYENAATEVPLAKEVEFLDNYVQLMRLRLPVGFDLRFSAKTSSSNDIRIAPVIFISLIENAFKHGVSTSSESFIHMEIEESGSHVILTIVNSNYPKLPSDKSGSGIGLELVKRRLDLLYPHSYEWEYGVDADLKTYRSRLDIDTSAFFNQTIENPIDL